MYVPHYPFFSPLMDYYKNISKYILDIFIIQNFSFLKNCYNQFPLKRGVIKNTYVPIYFPLKISPLNNSAIQDKFSHYSLRITVIHKN